MKDFNIFDFDFDSFYESSRLKSHVLSENVYKMNVVKKESLPVFDEKGFVAHYSSYELIPIEKAVRLRKIFIYVLYSNNLKIDADTLNKIKRNYKTLSLILNGIQQGSYTFVTINNILYLKFNSEYGYTKKHELGRLYPKRASITHISKEFRSLLFKGIYQDVDIVNAHPTILFLYAKNRGLKSHYLEQLVHKREEFYNCIYKEYHNYLEKKDLKRIVIACLNMDKKQFKSKLLTCLNKEIMEIRNDLYQEYYLKDDNFKAAVDTRMNLDNTLEFSKKLQKIQSLYCYNIETDAIMNFRSFLLEKWDGTLFSCVPFFDGLFIESISLHTFDSNNFTHKEKYNNLDQLIKEFNESSDIKFGLKEINSTIKFLPENQFTKLINTVDFLDKLTYSKTTELLEKYNISQDIGTILTDTLESKASNSDVSFSFEDIQKSKDFVNKKYADFIDSIIKDQT